MHENVSQEYINKIKNIDKKINDNREVFNKPNCICKEFVDKIRILIKYSENNKIDECDKHYLSFFSSKKDKELDELILKYNLMFDYEESYFQTCAILTDKILIDNKYELIYAYYFNFAHLLELTIKSLYKYKFISVITPTNHEFESMYLNAKDDILNLGLSNNDFKKIINSIKQIKSFTNYQSDLPVAFKYPVGKDFDTIIIKDKFLKMTISEKKKIIEDNKETIWIIELLIHLCYLKNSKDKLMAKNDTLNDMQEQIDYISKKYNI